MYHLLREQAQFYLQNLHPKYPCKKLLTCLQFFQDIVSKKMLFCYLLHLSTKDCPKIYSIFTSVLFLSSLPIAQGVVRCAVYTEREWCAVYSVLHSTSLCFIAGCSPFENHHRETDWWINHHLMLASEKLRSQTVLMG